LSIYLLLARLMGICSLESVVVVCHSVVVCNAVGGPGTWAADTARLASRLQVDSYSGHPIQSNAM